MIRACSTEALSKLSLYFIEYIYSMAADWLFQDVSW